MKRTERRENEKLNVVTNGQWNIKICGNESVLHFDVAGFYPFAHGTQSKNIIKIVLHTDTGESLSLK